MSTTEVTSKIPFIDLVAQYETIKPEIDSAIQSVINRAAFAGGPFVTEFDHCLPPIQAQRSKALAKKSRSTTSWPILACSFVTSASRFA